MLRGIAILGTLLTNIWIFAASAGRGFSAPGENPLAGEATDIAVNWATELSTYIDKALNLVTDGKFIGLLTIMFGIGLEIQRQSAIRRGETWPGRYPWRAGLLVLDGLLNYIFIFEFDVLMGYGLTGLVVAAVMARSPKAQKIWMVIGISAHVILLCGMDIIPRLLGVNSRGDAGGDTGMTSRITEEEFRRLGGTDDGVITDGFPNIGAGGYWEQVVSRLDNFIGGRGEIPVMFIMGLGLFLVGAHLYRAGIFEERGAKLRKWTMLLSFGIGLPIDWGLRLFAHDGTGGITRYGTSSMVAFGVLALVAEFYVRRTRRIDAGEIPGDRPTGWLGHALSLVGRMALTCYIGQNLIASIVFYEWGFGASRMIQGQYFTYWTLLIYLGIAAFLVAFSALWLRRFPRGPVELVWHKSYEAICGALDRRAERKKAKKADAGAESGNGDGGEKAAVTVS
ncbi:DUF418 domain-containing protein [Corynebacterium hansenii]|uniref:DUF418 domain-containing protein n=1 Tax=Corynebacterium hansenii TaxID=394964 RepID=A0ABV7ZMP3_9CORY|nr:DUF418 domain-containing protein [Corynebacterium hansenii]WJY98803.1 hypothetical protein CHAN_00820 [Corynebacterium hansenii]